MKMRLVLDFWGSNPPVESSEMESPVEHVLTLLRDGFTSGDLSGDDYSGWWKIERAD